MKSRCKKGFTVVELMVSLVAGLIVILATGTILVASQNLWNQAWEKANLQRDSSNAMLIMNHSIRSGTSASVEDDGKAIKIFREGGWIRFSHSAGSKSLECQVEGGEPQTVIGGIVEDVTFSKEGNKVAVDLQVKKGQFENHCVSSMMIRNY